MSIADRYTEQEFFLLSSIPSMVGSCMTFAESSGLGTVKEMFSSAQSIMAGAKQYPDNQLIEAILPNLDNREEAMAEAKAYKEKSIQRMKDLGIDSHEKMRAQILDDCRQVSTILAKKSSPQESEDYKSWIMSIAENVAMAAKEGGILGIGGKRLSEAEIDLFNQIAHAMGASAQLTQL
ncbi:MAG: hypothetical protein K0U68_16205 [Gammaproteobacteria bacterium]|nr:hypothetical protein [Gammaproteobacteria bacterium]